MHRTITQKDARGRRVLLRACLDVPVGARGALADTFRMERALPTLRLLQRTGARTVVLGHRGEPHGRTRTALSLRPLLPWFRRALGAHVQFAAWPMERVERLAASLRAGDVLLVENLRFHTGEEHAHRTFARQLARLGDLFVNDDFATAHRAHASTALVPRLLPAYAGLLFDEEFRMLRRLRTRVAHPAIAVIGGSKVRDKLDALRVLLRRYDRVLLGGVSANTVLAARGMRVGASRVDTRTVAALQDVADHTALVLPVDARVATSLAARKRHVELIEDVRRPFAAYDLGPASIARFAPFVQTAATVFWSGPLGAAEHPAFAHATRRLAALLHPRRTFAVAGGGDTVAALRRLGLARRFSYLSTGGSAMLAFLAGHPLPAVQALSA